MRQIKRPIHSGFETLRISRLNGANHFNRAGYPAFEQVTALALALPTRESALHTPGLSR